MKKFELTAECVTNIFGKKLFRIKALVAFGDVKEGDLGGSACDCKLSVSEDW